jgi:hypothetical protein
VFALTAFDVLGSSSLHLLAHVDAAAHDFVVSNFPATAEARFAANAISDVPIATAVAAAATAGLASGVHTPLRTLRRAALAAAAFFAPGWHCCLSVSPPRSGRSCYPIDPLTRHIITGGDQGGA